MAPDINNPGVVEVANQGYPRAPDGGTPAPTNENVRVADQAEPPAPLDTVFSTNPPPPLQPVNPADQGNPLGLPVNLTVPAQDPVLLADVQDINTAIDGDPPVNPKTFLVSQAGSIETDSAEAIQEGVIGFPDTTINIVLDLTGCQFVNLTAGSLLIRFYCSDGVIASVTLSLADLQALGPVTTATVALSPATTGKIIVGTQTVVTAFQGPGLATASFTVQRAGNPAYITGELVPATNALIGQTVNVGVQGAASNVVTITDNEVGGPPQITSVNLRLTFQMLQSFISNGVALNGRPIDFEEIDASRPILIMAAFYLVIANANDDGSTIVTGSLATTGMQLGAIVSFDTARYAGEMIFQVSPYATQDVGFPTGDPPSVILPPAPGIPAGVMTLRVDLTGCNFSALLPGSDIIVLVTLANGVQHYHTFNSAAFNALGNIRTAYLTIAFDQGGPPLFVLPTDIVMQAVALIWTFTGPGLTAATLSVQRVGQPDGEIIPTTTAIVPPGPPYLVTHDFNISPPQVDPSSPTPPAVNVNVADQVLTIGTPINVFP